MRVIWLFLAWTMVEIGLFASVGGMIGVLATWGVVVGTAALGIVLIRWQKRTALEQVMRDLQTLGDPLTPAAHSALIVLAGVFLILPGFLTDVLGLILLLPPVRNALIGILREKARMAAVDRAVDGMLHPRPSLRPSDVIDVVAEELPPSASHPHKPSGWTKP
jgi:UPF0716 protein FxsA